MGKKADIVISIALFIFCGLYFYLSLSFTPQARFLPQYVIALLFLLTIGLFISALPKKTKNDAQDNVEKKKEEPIIFKRVMGVLIISLLYVFLLDKIGFYITTAFYLTIVMYFLGIKNYKLILFITVFFTSIIFIIFKFLLEVSTPKGILF